MPLLCLHTSIPVDRAAAESLLLALSREIATGLAKPEAYVATSLVHDVAMTFGGTGGPACLVEIANIGKLGPPQTAQMSRSICQMISDGLTIPKSRIYVRFFEVERHLWGHEGGNFA